MPVADGDCCNQVMKPHRMLRRPASSDYFVVKDHEIIMLLLVGQMASAADRPSYPELYGHIFVLPNTGCPAADRLAVRSCSYRFIAQVVHKHANSSTVCLPVSSSVVAGIPVPDPVILAQ